MTFGRTLSTILSFTLFFPLLAFSADTDIFISEVQIIGDTANDDFIELYNKSEKSINISNWELRRKSKSETGNGSLLHKFQNSTIPGKHFFLWTNKDGKAPFISFADVQSKNITSPILSDNNSLALFADPKSPAVDSIGWKDATVELTDSFSRIVLLNPPKNKSLIRNLQTLEWSISDHPSPTNSCDNKKCPEIIEEEKIPIDISLRINELLPNPDGTDDLKEWVELFNFGTTPIDLNNWKVITASGSHVDLKESLSEKNFLAIAINQRNKDDTISLINPSGTIISVVSYENAPSGNSLNFFKQGIYRWSDKVTKGKTNEFNNAPETKEKDIPDTAYLDVLTTFSATGKDGDGDTIKYTWDFGDGHKSYKGETTHRYAKEGKYEGTLTVTDGTESVVTHFTVEVEKYEAPKVRMTTLVPNPAGKDTDTEYITIENRSKKSVDLLGWSIATGWKKLVNHPIRESFVIPKKSKRDITHAFSAFTLPNEKGRIELRSPDGETVQKLKYNLKGKSAEENARLVKEKGKKWEWMLNQETGSEEQRTTKTADAPPAGGTTAVLNLEEEQLKQDTKTITQRKNHGEILLSIETNAQEEMKRLISYGTNIETPAVILALAPRVAGASDETTSNEEDSIDTSLDINALINDWLARK